VKARATNRAAADHFAANVLPIVREIRTAGRMSLCEIAATLNARGIRAVRSGQWGASSMRYLLIQLSK
jgi:hypothetical protein